ncbi:MAG TPA: NAD(P)/FAD-dependent oxidoreductase [Steroidobacteraceae bacterium]|nr:NAD(P)/FAD-dependent oxidoreductase [Steroidobacteraceae bacterium]
MEHVDVIIVGAGVSGLDTAVHLQRECRDKSFLILDGRSAIGGTWDLFRYPGVRSDTDAYTYAYPFKPWLGRSTLAAGKELRDYLREVAVENGIDRRIRFRHRVTRAEWSTRDARWIVDAVCDDATPIRLSCNFLAMCSGYYSYQSGHEPDLAGREDFRGAMIHPQKWPEGLDCRGKRIVVIGSGATAVTLVPALANQAAHVVMLQRSPTYVMSIPACDPVTGALNAILPRRWANTVARLRFIAMQVWLYRHARRRPARARRAILDDVRRELGDACDVDMHFSPRYQPWDQRVCFVPDGDLFAAIREGRASVVTDRIARLTESGVALESGAHIDADVIVTATGLELVTPGEMDFAVDGRPVDFSSTWTYKGRMFSGVPNLVHTMGYVNAAWTLRADLTAEFTCRLLRHMDATGTRQVTPQLRPEDRDMTSRPWIDSFTPGYMQRVMGRMPRQGDCAPWLNPQDYLVDRALVRSGPVDDDGALVFGNRPVEDAGIAAAGEARTRSLSARLRSA